MPPASPDAGQDASPNASRADPIRGKRLFGFVLGSVVLANFVPWLLGHLLRLGSPPSIKDDLKDLFHVRQWTDSWLPMMKSLDYFQAHPHQPLYFAHLYDTLIYSLASLLPLWLLRKAGVGDPLLLRLLAIGSLLAVVGTAVAALRMGRQLLARRGQQLDGWTIAAVAVACLFCYPLLKGYSLGNAQTFLSFGFALLLMLWSDGRERAGGVVAALLTFVKPQYGLLLIWMAVRRRWGAAVAFLATAAVLILLSTLVFGWHNNLDYLTVLSSLSRKAQSHYGNQSMFGTLNRMIGNGENISYTPHLYTPYIPWVYRTTVLTALAITGTMLLFPWGRLRGSAGDLGAMGLASVAASPMAWEHHYGIVFGLFAWAWFAYGAQQQRPPWLLGLSFFLTCNFLSVFNLLAPFHGLNILQSYMYFGALLLMAVLCATARAVTRGDAEPVA